VAVDLDRGPDLGPDHAADPEVDDLEAEADQRRARAEADPSPRAEAAADQRDVVPHPANLGIGVNLNHRLKDPQAGVEVEAGAVLKVEASLDQGQDQRRETNIPTSASLSLLPVRLSSPLCN